MNNRKQFIKNSTLSVAGLTLFGACTAATNQAAAGANGTLRVALMGLGSYANRVASSMQNCKRAKVTGLISGTPSKLQSWGEKWGVPENSRYNYENFHLIKDNKNVDAIYVITPNGLHHLHTIGAARAGKHVICEKPMAINAKEAAEMNEECRKAGVKLLIGYRMHFEPHTLHIVSMRKAGEFGKIKFFQGLSGFNIGNPGQWRLNKKLAGGGALMDIGVYSINGARYMVGEEPVWVTAQETKTNPEKFKEGVDETIQFQLGFPGGAVASCLSTYAMNNLDKFFLNGERGFANLHPATGYGPIRGNTHHGELNQPIVNHQEVQMDEMAAIILDGKEPMVPVDGIEGWKDMVIIDGIYEALRTGNRVALNFKGY